MTVERRAHGRLCFSLISQKWDVYQQKARLLVYGITKFWTNLNMTTKNVSTCHRRRVEVDHLEEGLKMVLNRVLR